MNMEKNKIIEFLEKNYGGSYRFVKEKMFVNTFGADVYNTVLAILL